jgi:hypothetical protein
MWNLAGAKGAKALCNIYNTVRVVLMFGCVLGLCSWLLDQEPVRKPCFKKKKKGICAARTYAM